jgi:multidrug transporter EmrE-like cation transporter
MWIWAAFFASIFFTVSAIMRGLNSHNWLSEKGLLCIATFLMGLIYIIRHLAQDSATRKPFLFWQPDFDMNGQQLNNDYKFRRGIFLVTMLRGALEFTGSLFFLWSFSIALENSVNQGICSSMVTMAGLMITIMSWIAYNERLTFPQVIGMILILTAITLMGVYQESPDQGQDSLNPDGASVVEPHSTAAIV